MTKILRILALDDDPSLFKWLVGKEKTPPQFDTDLFDKLKVHTQSNPLNYQSKDKD